jgi:hypothetical protein
MKKTLWSIVLAITVLSGVAHAVELATLEQKVRLYATPYADQYKNPCVCNEPGDFEYAAGILRYAVTLPVNGKRQVHVWCHAWHFTPSGEPQSSAVCDTFTVLAK